MTINFIFMTLSLLGLDGRVLQRSKATLASESHLHSCYEANVHEEALCGKVACSKWSKPAVLAMQQS